MSSTRRPTVVERLSGIRKCGCSDTEVCPQHLQALSFAERREYKRKRGQRGTGRGHGGEAA